MKKPKSLKPGQVWGKVSVDRNGVRRVITFTILWTLPSTIWYTPRRAMRRCTTAQWQRVSKGMHLARMVRVQCIGCHGSGRVQESGALSPFIKCTNCKSKGHFN